MEDTDFVLDGGVVEFVEGGPRGGAVVEGHDVAVVVQPRQGLAREVTQALGVLGRLVDGGVAAVRQQRRRRRRPLRISGGRAATLAHFDRLARVLLLRQKRKSRSC